ncbi:MAG: elongation factor Ts [Micavibrio sp.]|nr:elongation factor Ts [Micavibrio sp.]|tara:strand:- start:3849 stop:4748 length:900 start_codon:yes stop_codon:yes gene_type:complete
MAEITTAKIKELREKTGAGMMDAKKALTEAGGDMDAAIEELRKKGMAKADKKSSRTAAEGLVAVVTSGTKGAVIELNAETDFVSRNEEFQAFVKKVAEKALEVDTIEELAAADLDGKSVKDSLTDLIAKIGENMSLRRMQKVEVSEGAVIAYVHGALIEGMGKIGVLVGLESSADAASLQATGKQVAMHVAAAFPKYLDRDSVDPEAAEKERTFLVEQAMAEGKPEEIANKMVEGRMRKYYEEVCLLDQKSVIDGETRIEDVVKGVDAKLIDYARFQLGDGIEKEEEDFAAEVSKVANG